VEKEDDMLVSRVRLAAGMCALLATACGGGSGAATPAGPSSAPAPAAFPVTVAGAGGSVAIARRPVRIVSLSPTATEMLYAIGAGGQVVAVDADSDYPASAPRTQLSGFQPNVEAIAGYRPDLIVASSDPGGLVRSLSALAIPVLIQPAAQRLTGSYAQLRALGAATGHRGAARRVVARMRSQIARIVASVPKPHPPLRVYHELDDTYFSATSATFIGQVYSMFGLRDIADAARGAGSGYPQLSSEAIVKADPQLIVLADTVCCHQTAATVAARSGWSGITAVRTGQVVPVNDDIASRWGPRIVDFFRIVARHVRAAAAADAAG
jgi:iron complex transport system substrate-binding protein